MSTQATVASKPGDATDESTSTTTLADVVAEDLPLHSYEVFSATLRLTEDTIRRVQ